MPETTEDRRPNGPAEEVPFHYVLTVQYGLSNGGVASRTEDGIAYVRPGFSRTAVYQQCTEQLLAKLPSAPDSVAVLFFELAPERLAA